MPGLNKQLPAVHGGSIKQTGFPAKKTFPCLYLIFPTDARHVMLLFILCLLKQKEQTAVLPISPWINLNGLYTIAKLRYYLKIDCSP